MYNNKRAKIFYSGILLVLISATPIILSQSAEAGVKINDELIYSSTEGGVDNLEYVKLICKEIDDTTNPDYISKIFDIYFSPNLTSWPSTPDDTDQEYDIFNASDISGMDIFPSLFVEPGLSIGTLADQIETELNLNSADTITVTSINNSAGIRIEVDGGIDSYYSEVIYDNNGILI